MRPPIGAKGVEIEQSKEKERRRQCARVVVWRSFVKVNKADLKIEAANCMMAAMAVAEATALRCLMRDG